MGKFVKYINNTGEIIQDEDADVRVLQKAEAFTHYSFVKSGNQFLIVDLRGVGYTLCDLEIASKQLFLAGNKINSCVGIICEL